MDFAPNAVILAGPQGMRGTDAIRAFFAGGRSSLAFGRAAWLLEHNDADGQPAVAVASALNRTTSAAGELTCDEILDNIALYRLTNTGVSASRLYGEYMGGFFNAKAPRSRRPSARSQH